MKLKNKMLIRAQNFSFIKFTFAISISTFTTTNANDELATESAFAIEFS